MINNPNSTVSEVFDLFPQMRKEEKPQLQKRCTLQRQISEVILGQRPFLKVHSKTLQKDLWFVNEGLANPTDPMFDGKIITMEMLAEIMSSGQPFLQAVEEFLARRA